MAQVLIRDLEPEVVERLKNRAKRHNRSLQKELKMILEEASHFSQRLSLDEFMARAETIRKRLSDRTHTDSVDLVREDRER